MSYESPSWLYDLRENESLMTPSASFDYDRPPSPYSTHRQIKETVSPTISQLDLSLGVWVKTVNNLGSELKTLRNTVSDSLNQTKNLSDIEDDRDKPEKKRKKKYTNSIDTSPSTASSDSLDLYRLEPVEDSIGVIDEYRYGHQHLGESYVKQTKM